MTFAQQIQEIRQCYRPGDPLAVQTFMRSCGVPLRRIVRRALRSHVPDSSLMERIHRVVSALKGERRQGTTGTPLSISLICQQLCDSLLWGEKETTPMRTEILAETWCGRPRNVFMSLSRGH